jgi:phenolic acid decarboxylase
MEKSKVKKYLEDHKETILKYHEDFYKVINKVQSYEKITKQIISNADVLVKDNGGLDTDKLVSLIIANNLNSKIDEMFGNK